jgi:hypothetical protein
MSAENKVIFESIEEFEIALNKILKDVKKDIDDTVIKDTLEYTRMRYQGLLTNDYASFLFIPDSIERGLKSLGCNETFAQDTGFEIMNNIETFFDGMIEAKVWEEIIYPQITEQQIANIIYYTIKKQLWDEDWIKKCIFSKILHITCKECKKNKKRGDIRWNTYICYDCYPIDEY